MGESLVDKSLRLLGPSLMARGFVQTSASEDQSSDFGAAVSFETSEIRIDVVRDRGQEWIAIGSKLRRHPRVPRSSWSLGHLLGFLDGRLDAYGVTTLEQEAQFLEQRADQLLDRELLDSVKLNEWAAKASRRLLRQRPR